MFWNNIKKYTYVISSVFFIFLFIGISYFSIMYSEYQMNKTSYELSYSSQNKVNFSSISNRLNITFFEDSIDNKSNISYEIRKAIIDNMSIRELEKRDEYFLDQIMLILDHVLKGEKSETINISKITKAYLYLRLRDYETANKTYKELLDVYDDPEILTPLLIFKAFSSFMMRDIKVSLSALDKAQNLDIYSYQESINYLRRRIYGFLRERASITNDNSMEAGLLYLSALDFITASEIFLHHLKNTPEEKERALFYLARIEEELGNLDFALHIYKTLSETQNPYRAEASFRGYIITSFYLGNEDSDLLKIIREEKGQEVVSIILKESTYQEYISKEMPLHREQRMNNIPNTYEDLVVIPKEEDHPIEEEPFIIYDLFEEDNVSIETEPRIVEGPTEKELLEQKIQEYEYKLDKIAETIENKILDLRQKEQAKKMRDTTSIISYTSSAVSLGIAGYNGYQIFQTNSLLAQGIDPSTVQGISADTGLTTQNALISGGISLGTLALGLTLNSIAWFGDTEEKNKALQKEIEGLMNEQEKLIHDLEEIKDH